MKIDTELRSRTVLGLVLATVVFLVSSIPLYSVTRYSESLSLDLAEWSQANGYPSVCIIVAIVLGQAVALLPSFGLGLHVFCRCLRRARRDGYTRCSECSYILNGLGGLRCPECGKLV